MKHDQIILYPLVTEKTAISEGNGKYTFEVLAKTNKIEVKKAIEKIFGAKVESVNIINTKSKKRRRGKTVGIVSGFKKAIVTLKKGEKIKIREEKKEKKPAKQEKTEKIKSEDKKTGVKTNIKQAKGKNE